MQELAEPQPVREQATNLKISVNLISTRYIYVIQASIQDMAPRPKTMVSQGNFSVMKSFGLYPTLLN